MVKSVQVDQYILKSPDFAQIILDHIRFLVHSACPDIQEQIKWGFPNFIYKGKILCHMAAYKQHCSFGFWNSEHLEDQHQILQKIGKTSMGQIGRIESIEQFPDGDIVFDLLKSAMHQIDSGIVPKKSSKASKPVDLPEILISALNQAPEAKAHFERFTASQKREYIDWIKDAKADATKERRLQTIIEWVSEGKTRQWKYQKK